METKNLIKLYNDLLKPYSPLIMIENSNWGLEGYEKLQNICTYNNNLRFVLPYSEELHTKMIKGLTDKDEIKILTEFQVYGFVFDILHELCTVINSCQVALEVRKGTESFFDKIKNINAKKLADFTNELSAFKTAFYTFNNSNILDNYINYYNEFEDFDTSRHFFVYFKDAMKTATWDNKFRLLMS